MNLLKLSNDAGVSIATILNESTIRHLSSFLKDSIGICLNYALRAVMTLSL